MTDEVVFEWPDRFLKKVSGDLEPHDAICILTQDPKFDMPADKAALDAAVGHLGAMGSRRTTAGREERLRAAEVDDADLARVMAPLGLEIGARTPEEPADSLCAEIDAVRANRGVRVSLRRTEGPIHQRRDGSGADKGTNFDQVAPN
jgi:xanthine dehydrogenase accessory factor